MSHLHAKIKQCRIDLGLTQEEMAGASGFAQRDISRFETGRAKTVPNDFIQFLHKEGVDLNRLFDETVEASPNASLIASLNSQNQNESYISDINLTVSHRAENRDKERILVATQDLSGNPVFTVINFKAAANYLTGYQTQEYYENLAAVSLPRQLVGNPRQGIFLQIEGDSMETKFHHGDYVAAQLTEAHEYDQIRDNDCYIVVSTTYGIQFKRIKNRLRDMGFIRCRSDNRRHPSYNIEAENLLQLYRFVLHVSSDASNPNDTLYGKLDNLEDTTSDLRVMYEQMAERMEEQARQVEALMRVRKLNLLKGEDE